MAQDTTLSRFRHAVYGCFVRQKDALQNLLDGLLTQDTARALPELSLAASCLRQWPSLYAALQDGVIDAVALRRTLCHWAPLPSAGRLVLGGDATSIMRPQAVTAADRTAQHLPNLPQAQHAVQPGWQFSQVVVLPAPASSWVYVLDQQRIASTQTPSAVLAEQLQALVPDLVQRPVLVADRGYGSASFLQATAEVACDLLIRIPRNRVFYRPAPPRTGKRGRPRRHGARFVGTDMPTHGPAGAEWQDDPSHVIVCMWTDLHLKAAPDQSVTVLQVIRSHAAATQRDPRESWFLWRGETPPPLDQVVAWYRRRYSQEHGFRFAKQSLVWTDVRVRTPDQFARWSHLVGIAQSTLRLARDQVAACRLPWHAVARPSTPQQVRRALAPIFAQIGSPATVPQLRGKSPGRPNGWHPPPVPRFPVVRKLTKAAK